MSCALWGDGPSLPNKFKWGYLDLCPADARWTSRSGECVALPRGLRAREVRAVRWSKRPGEGNVKRSVFAVVVCESDGGPVDFAVPGIDAPLVLRYFS